MIRLKSYDIETVFTAMSNDGILPDGNKFKPKSQRLILFQEKGIKCVTCGIVGSIFWYETHHENITPHLNLYAVSDDDTFILMTKDHIYPKSKGGLNELSNYQTMCTECNRKKSDSIQE